jgi:hypothetical protein
MPQLLIVLGVVLALAGLGGIAAGAPSWALGLGLGSTLIQSGTISFVGGLILIGMSLMLRSVQELARRIEMLSRAQAAIGRQLPPPAHDEQPMPAPQGREFARDPREQRGQKRPRREPPPVAAQNDDRYPQDDRYPPQDDRRMPPERRAPPPDRRMQPAQQVGQEEWGAQQQAPDPYAQNMAPPPPQRGRPHEPPAPDPRAAAVPTVVRSGIIGGMAYTLYSDGSIEAELPIGTVRFDSIQELQEHVSNTGMDADMQFNEPVR